jgi:radical SAM-linked protein
MVITGYQLMDQGQRLYIVFSRGRRLRFLSHLDMMRLWERALRRARVPLRYSQGYHPHPRLSLALPLAVGVTAEAEWLECELRTPLSPAEVQLRLSTQLPAGIALCQVLEAPWKAPSLAARLRTSTYEVQVHRSLPLDEAQERVERLRQAAHWVVEEPHKGRVRSVDVRAMVDDVQVGPWAAGQQRLHLVLRHQDGRSARVETVLKALDLGPAFLIHRQGVSFDLEPDRAVGQ